MAQLDLFLPTHADATRTMPASPGDSRAVKTGDAGEHLVLAKLRIWGFRVLEASRDCPYDLAVDLGQPLGLIRVQVKCTTAPRKGRWHFSLKRGYHNSVTGVYAYASDDYDISAFVALTLERVLFAPGVLTSYSAGTPEFLREDGERRSWLEAVTALRLGSDRPAFELRV